MRTRAAGPHAGTLAGGQPAACLQRSPRAGDDLRLWPSHRRPAIVAVMASTVRLRLFNSFVNPGVSTVVRHRPHGRLARAVGLLSYQGRVSGRSFTIPVEYAKDADGGYVIVPGEPEHKNWWKNFRTPVTVRFLAAGDQITGRAVLIAEPAERRDALAVYFRRFPAAARTHSLPRQNDGSFDQVGLGSLADRLAVIRISPQRLTKGRPAQVRRVTQATPTGPGTRGGCAGAPADLACLVGET